MRRLAGDNVGMTFATFFSTAEFAPGFAALIMLFDAALYLLLALYLDAVWPWREYGVAKHPLFFLRRSRSAKRRVVLDDLSSKEQLAPRGADDSHYAAARARDNAADDANNNDVEVAQYADGDVAVRIRNLRKTFGKKDDTGQPVYAVNHLSLDMLQGEVKRVE